jgi:hypothetical protein
VFDAAESRESVPDRPTPEAVDLVAQMLREHVDQIVRTNDGGPTVTCSCGQWRMAYDHLGITEIAAEHRRHWAAAILAALAAGGHLADVGLRTAATRLVQVSGLNQTEATYNTIADIRRALNHPNPEADTP